MIPLFLNVFPALRKGPFVFVAILMAVARVASLAAASEKPNIIFVMADDMGWGQTGYRGHPVLKTPHLDAMAQSGLRFERFYAGAPVCSPTRASVLTGRSNDRTGALSHGYALRLQEKTIAQAMKKAGYVTGHFGKWHLNGLAGPGVPILPTDPRHPGHFGFDEWVSVSNFYDQNPLMSRNGKIEAFFGDSSEIAVEEAVKFFKNHQASQKPFFATIWYGTPHNPFKALERDKKLFATLGEESAHHYGELVALDRSIGRLRQALRDLGVAEKTLLVFCSDNGGLGAIQPETVGGLRGLKGSLFEGGIRVPGIMEWPGVIKPRITSYPASTMDLFPTVADVVGLPKSDLIAPVDGESLKPLFASDPGVRTKPIPFRYQEKRAWMDHQYKLVSDDISSGVFHLFDLVNDPKESKDLRAAEPERFASMKRQLLAWNASVDASFAGQDYPEGKVIPPDPPSQFWFEASAYQPYLAEWEKRPEYQSYIENRRRRGGRKPNLVWIMADDLGYGELGSYGQKLIQTPALDQMAREGLRFTQFYAGATVCAPSRSVLMTGQHHGHTRVRGNAGGNNARAQSLQTEDVTVAEALKKAGYRTALLGKWGLGDVGAAEEGLPRRQGFDYFFGYLNQTHAHNHFPDFLWRNEERVSLPNVVTRVGKQGGGYATEAKVYADDLFAEEAIKFVRENRGAPFFLYWSPVVPHINNERWRELKDAADVPDLGIYADRDWARADKGHAAAISRLDSQVGKFLGELKRAGLAENTLVIFTSDNGPHREGNRDLELFESAGPFRGVKRSLTDGGIRVPAIAWWPGRIKPGVSHHVAYFGDWFATACELAKAQAPSGLDSISFASTLLGRPEQQKRHQFLYWEFHEGGFSQAALLDGRWKGIRRRGQAALEVFDLKNDPGEEKDVAGLQPDIRQKLEIYLESARSESADWPERGPGE